MLQVCYWHYDVKIAFSIFIFLHAKHELDEVDSTIYSRVYIVLNG